MARSAAARSRHAPVKHVCLDAAPAPVSRTISLHASLYRSFLPLEPDAAEALGLPLERGFHQLQLQVLGERRAGLRLWTVTWHGGQWLIHDGWPALVRGLLHTLLP